jgi:hypothetical protein
MKTIPVNIALLLELTAHMQGRVGYGLGAKAPSLDCDSSAIHEIDCSGFVRYALYRSTLGRVITPDGSVEQHSWIEAHGFKQSTYDVNGAGAVDSHLRIAFIQPKDDNGIGHVWLIYRALTLESHGGKGVDRRPWNTPVLIDNVAAVYVLT